MPDTAGWSSTSSKVMAPPVRCTGCHGQLRLAPSVPHAPGDAQHEISLVHTRLRRYTGIGLTSPYGPAREFAHTHALRHHAQNPVPGPTTATLAVARRWASAHHADRGISHGADAPSRPGRPPDGWASLPPGIAKHQRSCHALAHAGIFCLTVPVLWAATAPAGAIRW